MIPETLAALKKQTVAHTVVVVENASTDESRDLLRPLAAKNELVLLENKRNLGFSGGVNTGITYALEQGADAVALMNNDAIPDSNWLKHLVKQLEDNPKLGMVAAKILDITGTHIDSTGDQLTIWGLPYPRGRGEVDTGQDDTKTRILGASAGAAIYRATMLHDIGLFDPDFFAYYEDIDISLRARLAGWEIELEPRSVVHHRISATSSRIPGFTTKQTLKNLPWVLVKDIPAPLLWRMAPRLFIAYWAFFASAIQRGAFRWALQGWLLSIVYMPKKLWERRRIQGQRRITAAELAELITYDLPPNATKLRRLRSLWWKLRGRHG